MGKLAFHLAAFCFIANGQDAADLKKILERLDKLESENRSLRNEVRELRTKLEGPSPPPAEPAMPSIEERLDVAEKRIDEQAQTKVEVSQRFPLKITGMALINGFANMRHNGGNDFSTTASFAPARMNSSLSLKQSIIGLKFDGPLSVLGAKVSGNIFMDFYDGNIEGNTISPRIRTGALDLDWTSRSLRFGYEKPIFSPREPSSLANVGVSPLTSAGNLWRWQPQVRFEQRFKLAAATMFKAQVGIMQTSEDVGSAAGALVDRRRPATQGRFEFSHDFGGGQRIEFAPGFSVSQTHLCTNGQTIPSRLFSMDWLIRPMEKIELTGIFWNGENIQHMGALRNGLRVLANGIAIPVHSQGGWAQWSILATNRITLNLMAGIHDDRNADLASGQNARNRQAAGNIMFRIAPNVVISFEGANFRSLYLGQGTRVNQRYDLAIAYMF